MNALFARISPVVAAATLAIVGTATAADVNMTGWQTWGGIAATAKRLPGDLESHRSQSRAPRRPFSWCAPHKCTCCDFSAKHAIATADPSN